MSLLQDMLNEMASGGSTGAGGVANARGALFGGSPADIKKSNRARMKVMRRIGMFPVKGFSESCKSDLWAEIVNEENEDNFDKQDVVSKLDAAETKANADKDTVVFGLEDEDENIVKVYVRADQGDDFEQALSAMLSGADEDEDGENTAPEIAEVLYNLKDKFEIVDVQWPTIDGDEEEEQDLEGGEEGDMEGGEGDAMDAEGGEGDAMDAEGGEGMEGEDGMDAPMDDTAADATSALQSVIDVMKADAEAKKAEAEARKAEADAEISKHAADASASKVKQEEEILDMETYEKAKSDADKEAKTLAKLAKYKHETAGSRGAEVEVDKTVTIDPDGGEENEEEQWNNSETISKEDLASLLFKAMQHN